MLKKITENVEIHQTLPDTPNLTSEELKKEWDKGSKIIKQYFNELIDSLNNAKVEELKEKNIITAYPTADLSNVSDNTLIRLSESVVAGDKLSLKDNAIVIGKGVSKIKVSGTIFYQALSSNQSYLFPNLKKNGTVFASPIVSKGVTDFNSAVFATTVEEVEEGDKITMTTGDVNRLSVGVRGGRTATYLTVEVVE